MVLKVLVTIFLLGLGVSVSSCSYLSASHVKNIIVDQSLKWTFNVHLKKELQPFEYVALTGEDELFGNWSPEKAIILSPSMGYNRWSTTVIIPENTTIHYRYFICAIDSNGSIQIRRWEANLKPRKIVPTIIAGESFDTFGTIDGVEDVQRGWLTNETLIQLKLFRNPFVFNENIRNRKIFIKLTPVDYDLENNKENLYTTISPSARANAEYMRLRYGDSMIKEQPEYGVEFQKNDSLIFHITVAEMTNVAYLMRIFSTDDNKPELRHLLGYQYILSETITGTEGKIEIQLISPVWLNSIGRVNLEYLVITPLPSPTLDFRTTFTSYWQNNWTALDVGHRGLGKSMSLSTGAPPITENTIASMKQSVLEGADMVEFDVQLTSDYEAVIAHDFSVYICLESKTPTSKDDLTEVKIKDLTYEQLKSLRTYRIVGPKIVEYPAHKTEPRKDFRLFPTLEDFFNEIDNSIGFDIEIKWPQMTISGESESDQTIDKNLFVDRISEILLEKGCGRLSFLTSFDADICTMFRFKQNMYPVMFLSPRLQQYVDPRSYSIKDAVNHAQAVDLLGVVPHTSHILADPTQVKLATNLNQKIFIWGDDSSSTNSVDYFKSLGVTGVIYDRIDLLIPDQKNESVFKQDHFQNLFQLQCLNSTFSLPKVVVAVAKFKNISTRIL